MHIMVITLLKMTKLENIKCIPKMIESREILLDKSDRDGL